MGHLEKNKDDRKEKYLAREMRAYILVIHIING